MSFAGMPPSLASDPPTRQMQARSDGNPVHPGSSRAPTSQVTRSPAQATGGTHLAGLSRMCTAVTYFLLADAWKLSFARLWLLLMSATTTRSEL